MVFFRKAGSQNNVEHRSFEEKNGNIIFHISRIFDPIGIFHIFLQLVSKLISFILIIIDNVSGILDDGCIFWSSYYVFMLVITTREELSRICLATGLFMHFPFSLDW